MEELIKKTLQYKNQLIAILSISLALVGITSGYLYYKKVREESAHKVLVGALEYFDAPIKTSTEEKQDDLSFLDKKEFKTSEEKWTKVDNMFKKAYEDNSGSGIASMFLVYRSVALMNLNKVSEAIKVIRIAIDKMKSLKVKSFFRVKLALLLIDSGQDAALKEGLEILRKSANQEGHIAQDTALYNLGRYYWHEKNFNEAKNYWNQLILKFSEQKENRSPWIDDAKEKLRLIDRDVE
jgi:hypothetical protein